jgi:hypothetical protein
MEKRKWILTVAGHEIEVGEDDEIDLWDGDRSAFGSSHVTVGMVRGHFRTIEDLVEDAPKTH